MKKIGKYVLMITAIAITVTIGACSRSADAATAATAEQTAARMASMDSRPVEAVEIGEPRTRREIVGSGIISAARDVSLVSETQGVISRVAFELGDRVAAGQLLVGFDDTIQRLTLDQARQLAEAAQLDLEATERLFSSGGVSRAALTNSRAALAGARAQAAQAEKAWRDRSIVAPFDATIASKPESIVAGAYLNPGTPIARLVDTSVVELRIAVGEREVGMVREGDRAYVTIPSVGADEFEARVAAIAAGSDQATGSFPIIVRWQRREGSTVRVGQSATVRIPSSADDPMVTAPARAVLDPTGRPHVFVAKDGIVNRRDIALGEGIGTDVEVRSGLRPGELVVTTGASTLSDGDKVTVSRVATVGASLGATR